MVQPSIQIQVRQRQLRLKLPADPCGRIRHTGVDTRGDEARKRESLRGPTTRTGREERTERESSVGGGPTSRLQDIRLDERRTGSLDTCHVWGNKEDVYP